MIRPMWLIKMEETDQLHHNHTTNVFELPEKAINSMCMLCSKQFQAHFFLLAFGDNYDFYTAISTTQCNIFGLLILYNTNYELSTSKRRKNETKNERKKKKSKSNAKNIESQRWAVLCSQIDSDIIIMNTYHPLP